MVPAATAALRRVIDPASPGAILLRAAIVERGGVEGLLLKVDEFLNHRVEPSLMAAVGETIALALSAT